MIVVTLSKVPKSLQGDLTKWCQEIQTGVYVGNVSARIREMLWDRIMKNIGRGEATIAYSTNNELGYQFKTTRKDRTAVDFDGLPLMMQLVVAAEPVKHGFSDASKFHRAKVTTAKKHIQPQSHVIQKIPIVTLDLETTGISVSENVIIAIGAVRRTNDGTLDQFYRMIKTNHVITKEITELTGLTPQLVNSEGTDLAVGLHELCEFIGDLPIIGYNLRFDEQFLMSGFRQIGQTGLSNRRIDLMPIVKQANKFLDNYRLQTVLTEYNIFNKQPHHALSDAQAMFELANELNKKGILKI